VKRRPRSIAAGLRALLSAYHAGRPVEQALLAALKPLVEYEAGRGQLHYGWRAPGMTSADFLGEAWRGAWEGVRDWRPGKGASTAFIASRIRGRLHHEVRDHGPLIHLPQHVQAAARPDNFCWSVADVVSLDEVLPSWEKTLPGPSENGEREERMDLQAALDRLPERHRRVVIALVVEGRTHAELARELGTSRGLIAHLCQQGLRRLRQGMAWREVRAQFGPRRTTCAT